MGRVFCGVGCVSLLVALMDRREFFRLAMRGAFGAAVAHGYDWDRLLWVPKPIMVVPGSMNSLITPEWVRNEMFLLHKRFFTLNSHGIFEHSGDGLVRQIGFHV